MKFITKLQPECEFLVSPEETCDRIALNVARVLEQQQKSWNWLAKQLGLHRGRMTKILTLRQLINVNTFANIAIVLGVSMDDLHRPIAATKTKKKVAS